MGHGDAPFAKVGIRSVLQRGEVEGEGTAKPRHISVGLCCSHRTENPVDRPVSEMLCREATPCDGINGVGRIGWVGSRSGKAECLALFRPGQRQARMIEK